MMCVTTRLTERQSYVHICIQDHMYTNCNLLGKISQMYIAHHFALQSVCLIMVTVINSTGWVTGTCCLMSMQDYLCMQTLSLLTLNKCGNVVLLFHCRAIDLNSQSEHKNPNMSNKKKEEAGCLRLKAVCLGGKWGQILTTERGERQEKVKYMRVN